MGILNYEVMFNTKLLTQITGLSILGVEHYPPPKRTLGNYLLAQSDKRKVNSAFNTERHILIRCCIQTNSRALRDVQFDKMLALIQGTEKQLIVPHGIGRRAFTATYEDFKINEDTGGYIEFTIDFVCSDSFGYDLGFTLLLSATGRTLYNYTDAFTGVNGFDGSAEWQAPIIKLTYTALTGGANRTVTILNPATGRGITIRRSMSAGDVYIIDCQNEIVTVNGVEVEYSGSIPKWKLGDGYLQVYDNLTTRTLTHFSYYYKRWL